MPCIKADMCPELNMHRFIPVSLLKYVSYFIKNAKILYQQPDIATDGHILKLWHIGYLHSRKLGSF